MESSGQTHLHSEIALPHERASLSTAHETSERTIQPWARRAGEAVGASFPASRHERSEVPEECVSLLMLHDHQHLQLDDTPSSSGNCFAVATLSCLRATPMLCGSLLVKAGVIFQRRSPRLVAPPGLGDRSRTKRKEGVTLKKPRATKQGTTVE
jgi:hypothetical protein